MSTLQEALDKERFAIYRDDLGSIFVVDNTSDNIIGGGYSRTVNKSQDVAIEYTEDGVPSIDGINDWFPTLGALLHHIHPYGVKPEWESVPAKKGGQG